MQHRKFGKLRNGNKIVHFFICRNKVYHINIERDKSENVSSAMMQLVKDAVVQMCDVLSFFCNLSKSLQESKVCFWFSFLR
jgi:hypothetical protein